MRHCDQTAIPPQPSAAQKASKNGTFLCRHCEQELPRGKLFCSLILYSSWAGPHFLDKGVCGGSYFPAFSVVNCTSCPLLYGPGRVFQACWGSHSIATEFRDRMVRIYINSGRKCATPSILAFWRCHQKTRTLILTMCCREEVTMSTPPPFFFYNR